MESKSSQANGRFQHKCHVSQETEKDYTVCVLPQSVVSQLCPVSITRAGVLIRGYHFVMAMTGNTGPVGS